MTAFQYTLTPADVITKFELQVSDITELSSQEELDLLQNVYEDVCVDRQWEVLKTSISGALTLDPTTGLYYLTLPPIVRSVLSFLFQLRSVKTYASIVLGCCSSLKLHPAIYTVSP